MSMGRGGVGNTYKTGNDYNDDLYPSRGSRAGNLGGPVGFRGAPERGRGPAQDIAFDHARGMLANNPVGYHNNSNIPERRRLPLHPGALTPEDKQFITAIDERRKARALASKNMRRQAQDELRRIERNALENTGPSPRMSAVLARIARA